MSSFVVDASVVAKWFVEEEHGNAALSVLKEMNSLHAPDFLLLEMDNIIWKWSRRGVVCDEEGSELRDAFRRYPIQYHPFVSFRDSAFAIANQVRQSVYDSLYVALAALLNARMVTADHKLYEGVRNSRYKKHILWIGDI